jgi:hypothetical protein
VLDAPAASYAKNRKHTSVVTTGSPVSPGIPARNGFNGFLRALLGDRLVCHRRWWNCFRQLDAGIEASGPHDFAVREKRTSSSARSRPRIPPRGRDDRDRPSLGRDGAGYESDLGEARRKIFLQMGLDRKSTNGVICSTGNQFDIIHCARRLRL